MVARRIINDKMQAKRILGAMPNVVVNRRNDTIIVDGLVKDHGFKSIVFAQEPKDIPAFSVVMRGEMKRVFGMLPRHCLGGLKTKACRICVGKFYLSSFFAAFEFCQMLFAPLVCFRLWRIQRTLDHTLKAIPSFTKAAAHGLFA
jgi:hypothetical protein